MTYEEFSKIDLRVGVVKNAERLEGSDKLLRLMVDAGSEVRQIIAGIGKVYLPEEMVGQRIIFVANLDPRMLMGQESQGMLLAAQDAEGNPRVVTVSEKIAPGAKIR